MNKSLSFPRCQMVSTSQAEKGQYLVKLIRALVVQWIEQPPPKRQIQVRFLAGAPKKV